MAETTKGAEVRTSEGSALHISARAFLTTVVIILCLMAAAGILTYIVPAGSYEHVTLTTEGFSAHDAVVPGSFHYSPRPNYPAWRWLTAPVEVLWNPGNVTVITIIVLLTLIGGSFTVLDKGGVLKAALGMIVTRFRDNKYALMASIILFFMLASSVLGIYEEAAPLVVFIVPLALYLGWDSLTGLGMSLLALGFGFAAAMLDPFMVTIAQKLSGLPVGSGLWFRAIFFVTIFCTVFLFVRAHARKVEKDPRASLVYEEDQRFRASTDISAVIGGEGLSTGPALRRGVTWLGIWLALAVVFMLVATKVPGLSDFAFPLMGLMIFVGCIGGAFISGMRLKAVMGCFLKGAAAILPAAVMILMAMSVKLIITKGGILDTILYEASGRMSGVSPYVAVLLVYFITLALEFFIPSSSAKAFLIIPILAPLGDLVGLTRQTVVFAFDNGDGFANILYPTNPMLMICLGLTVVSWPKWVRWTLPIQGVAALICFAFMALAVAIKYGPF